MEELATISYNDRLERLIADEGERTQGYAWLHEQSAHYYQQYNTFLALPIIVLSTLSGAISASSTALFTDPKGASLGIGALSIFVGVLSTVQSYFGFAKRAENHRLSGITYTKLNHFITIEMALPRRERMSAHDMLKIVRDQTGRLLETAPPIPRHVIREFQQRFLEKYPNVSIPDVANGLRSIATTSSTTPLLQRPSPAAFSVPHAPAPTPVSTYAHSSHSATAKPNELPATPLTISIPTASNG